MLRSKANIEKALCAWLNSTFAICYLKLTSTTLMSNFGHIRGWHLRVIPLPELAYLEVINILDEFFEEFQNEVFDSLPRQYVNALNGTDMIRLNCHLNLVKKLASVYKLEIDGEEINDQLLNVYRDLLEIIRE